MLAVGLMSGTSRDGIDAALIETDGEDVVRPLAFHEAPYTDATRALIARACELALSFEKPASDAEIDEAGRIVTMLHEGAVRDLLRKSGHERRDIGVIGFHGHTVAHRPDKGWTWQIGDGALIGQNLAIPTVDRFRHADMAAGGQGAPIMPVYHRALAGPLDKPVAFLNLGGIANLTFVGRGGDLIAFDCGMANALIDDWVRAEADQSFDRAGMIAASGRVDQAILTGMLDHSFFDAPAPKSLDRDDFSIQPVRGLSAADGAATLAAFSAQGVALGLKLLPERPARLLVTGGGRKNVTLMAMIGEAAGVPVAPVEAEGWNGDAIEAEGMAYLAARAVKYLPFTFPGTTGVREPLTGGTLFRPE